MAKILFLPGTVIHLKQMYKISKQLKNHDVYFAPYFVDGWLKMIKKLRIFDFLIETTALSERYRNGLRKEFSKLKISITQNVEKKEFDLVVVSTDLYLPDSIKKKNILLLQEGGLYPDGLAYHLVRYKILPRFVANTASFGLSDSYLAVCVASKQFKRFFISRGIKKNKICVTGMSEYDNYEEYRKWPCGYKKPNGNYILVCLSPSWESSIFEILFLLNLATQKAKELNLPIVVKVHPREKDNFVMWLKIAGYDVFKKPYVEYFAPMSKYTFLQSSTAIFSMISFGIPVFATKLDVDMCKKLLPEQNGGTSQVKIAKVIERIIKNN